MTATINTTTTIFSIVITSIALLVSPIGCQELQTGPQVTRDEIRRETQHLDVKKRQYEVKERQSPYAGKDLEQQKEVVNAIGSRLLSQAGSSMEIDFTVVENEAVNAGATFGKIVVTTAMMRFVRSEDELAAVLGHEIAHLEKGHITKGIIANLPVIIGSKVAESAVPGSGEVVEMGGSIFTQKFSRDMEREADYFGIHYAHNAGFDAAAGINVWERFAIELPESQRATIFSSHPSSTERMVRARKTANTLKEGKEAEMPPQH